MRFSKFSATLRESQHTEIANLGLHGRDVVTGVDPNADWLDGAVKITLGGDDNGKEN